MSRHRFRQQAQEQHFQPQARLHALTQLLFRPTQLVLPLQQSGATEGLGQIRQLIAELGRDSGEFRPIRCGSCQHQVSEDPGQALEHSTRIAAPVQQIAGRLQQLHRCGSGHRFHQLKQLLFRDRSQQIPHRWGFDRGRQQAELIQEAFGIAQTSLGALGHDMNGFRLDLDRFLLSDPAQMRLEGIEGDPPEIKTLAAAEDRGQHPLRVCCRQDEHHLWRRLLQGLEQSVERCGGQHVALVHHIHLPAGLHWGEARAFDQLPDVVNAGVGGGIDLDHIQGGAGGDRRAQLAVPAGLRRRPVAVEAIQRASQDPGA